MKHYIATAALIAAGTAFANAADLIWSQTGISLTGSNTYNITGVTISDGFTVKIDLSGWQAANGPIGWFTTTDGNGYANSAATFGWGKNANNAEWHATTFTSGGSATNQQAGENYDDAKSYGASGAFDTVLFLTVQSGTASLYEQTEAGNEVVLVAQTTGMSTSTVNGLYVGHWSGGESQHQGGTMDVGVYNAVLTTAEMASMIPEPSAFGLLAGLGALALVASRRRRK
ncbi:MAG TPA: PEP-CTERM sorting domain-containing protein [Candidatus Spyradosoma merdigallinarum]|uniref:PEP-CTERM sorting domain-containing protein n=1 Tax=Candidatus Spyradosoma merdigallinarum TaxID=2840950 RepID=A0A9D1NIU2_9BACT|nr:PEP-CTERM sorting domain-containing protein [Candidatus Spyradosoma merdigallinarum]